MNKERIKIKIVRSDFGKEIPKELKKRRYMALRKSIVQSVYEWNPIGRRYDIRGLCSLVNTPEIMPIFDNGIEQDLGEYVLKLRQERQV